MNTLPSPNPLLRLIHLVEYRYGIMNLDSPIHITIPTSLAVDLMGMNMMQWQEATNGSLPDDAIDRILSRLTTDGTDALNQLQVRGIVLHVSSDPNVLDIEKLAPR